MELFTEDLANTFEDRKKYNNLAHIAALIFSAPICTISLRLADKFVLIGRQGLNQRVIPRTFDLGEYADAPLWIEDLQRESDPRIKPLVNYLTGSEGPIRFFSSAPIVDRRFNRIGLVAVLDYMARFPDKRLARVLELIADTVRELLFFRAQSSGGSESAGWIDVASFKPKVLQLEEDSEKVVGMGQGDLSIAEKFLLDTLVARQSINSRNGVTYLSLRAWRKSVKKHQIDALREIKKAPTQKFVECVSREITEGLSGFIGAQSARIICHVPCGHSGKLDCLACLLAKQLAANLNLPFVPVFKPIFSGGSSHPKANLVRPAMEIDTPVRDAVLLVDDVASSGRHIEEAVNLIRPMAEAVFPIAWIGSRVSATRCIAEHLSEAIKKPTQAKAIGKSAQDKANGKLARDKEA